MIWLMIFHRTNKQFRWRKSSAKWVAPTQRRQAFSARFIDRRLIRCDECDSNARNFPPRLCFWGKVSESTTELKEEKKKESKRNEMSIQRPTGNHKCFLFSSASINLIPLFLFFWLCKLKSRQRQRKMSRKCSPSIHYPFTTWSDGCWWWWSGDKNFLELPPFSNAIKLIFN